METCDEKKKRPKQKFSEAWVNDVRFKPWIGQVSSDDTLYYCKLCDKNFSCSSPVSRHANSECHKNKMKENTSCENEQGKKSPFQQKFRQQWLDVKDFKTWLREVPDNANAFYCLICDRAIIGGLSNIHRHAESALRKTKSEESAMQANKLNEDLITQTDNSLLTFDERKKAAEIRYAALITEKNIPHQTAQEILSLFKDIGKEPNVLKSMNMGPTKCKNIISNVLCPVETERVISNLQNTRFSIFVDETSDITNNKWMTFLVRYVDHETLDIRSQLVKLINIDAKDSSAEKLFDAFQSEMYKLQIPFLNIIALSCDNASVMIGKHLSFKKKLESKCKNLLTFACPCHSAALAAHAACAKIPDSCEEFFKKIGSFINSSPKRSAIFNVFSECFQNSNHKILKLSDTRWLSHYLCVERILVLWDTIKYFLNEIVVSEKTKSGEYLLSLMENVDIKAYLLFLKYVLNFFNSFNAFFQAHETRINLLQFQAVTFLIQISENFIKKDLLANVLQKQSLDNITLGSECEEYLCNLVKEGHADVIPTIRQNCLQFYITAAEEIRKRLPVTDVFLYKFRVFNPKIALFDEDRNTSFKDISSIIKTLNGFDEDGIKKEWLTLYSDLSIEEKENLAKLNFDNMWKQILKRPSINNPKYPNLKSLLNAIRSLPRSNDDTICFVIIIIIIFNSVF